MRADFWRAIGFAVGAIALVVVATPSADAQDKFRLKMQTAVPSTGPHATLLKRFAANLDRMSAGRLKVEVLPAEIGRASGRESGCQYVSISVVAVVCITKTNTYRTQQ